MTLLELLIVLTMVGVLAAIVVGMRRTSHDALVVRTASRELVHFIGSARELAAVRGAAAIAIDSATGLVGRRAPGVREVSVNFRALYGVRLVSTRDSVAFDGRGLGWGAANVRIVLTRGRASDTITVSRLGRVK